MRVSAGGLALVAVALSACSGSPDGDPSDLISGRWIFVEGSTSEGHLTALLHSPITLESDAPGNEGVVRGQSSCNTYGFHPDYDGGPLAADGIQSSGAGCPGARQALETAYCAALAVVDHVSEDGDTLTLTGPGTTLTFDRQP